MQTAVIPLPGPDNRTVRVCVSYTYEPAVPATHSVPGRGDLLTIEDVRAPSGAKVGGTPHIVSIMHNLTPAQIETLCDDLTATCRAAA